MSVETIGEAYDASMCAARDGMKRICARSCGRAVGDAGEPIALRIAAGAFSVPASPVRMSGTKN
jgi:hypothetical protein